MSCFVANNTLTPKLSDNCLISNNRTKYDLMIDPEEIDSWMPQINLLPLYLCFLVAVLSKTYDIFVFWQFTPKISAENIEELQTTAFFYH